MKNVLFYGSGAVNLSLIGWLSQADVKITVLARSASAQAIREHGVQVLCQGIVSEASPVVVTSLEDTERPDLVVIGVKSYVLQEVVDEIRAAYGKQMPVLSVLNGIRHVDMLSSKFTHAMFATICYNAYREEPYRAVAMSRGPVVFSASRGAERSVRKAAFNLFKGRVEVVEAKDPMDVAANKLIINLTNALMTLVAFHEHRDRQLRDLQHITAHILWEGVCVMKASGVKEVQVPGIPPWRLLWMSRYLPQFITVPIFRKKMKVSAINSMAQDIQRGNETELQDINGRLVTMAQNTHVAVPYNKALYHIFKEWAEGHTEPMTPSEVRSRIRSFRRR